ncbi:MAG: nicotinate (nicotinamide) nucleotide adenylyltransferase [Acidobacteria bacterium]|nr:nicotinate (nicotinamide) nucleotide adenylyltransferase [Acidobacteriota bacterium]
MRIGILGGTLDPIHQGHIEAALAAREALALERVIIIPTHVPPHRSRPATSAYHRFAMASLAVNGVEGLCASDLELLSPGPSYTADTLLRVSDARGIGASQIFFITGADAFAEIETWSRYPEVLDLSNFIVVSRPGMSLSALRQRFPQLKARMRLPIGRATEAAAADETLIFLVEAPTPDISSTDIRRRLAEGQPVSGLVPLPVEDHIQQHALYTQQSPITSTANHLHGQN